ncbi:MAG: pilX, partial [Rhizobacter sp.]|nr:pilX [Rhizobacter sp.]
MLKHQRGVAALGIVLVMLTIMSLTMFYLNRGLLVEIKSTADHRRAAAAFEAAEAGLEWATALLDDPRLRNGLCEPDVGAGLSFRDRLLPLSIQPWTTPGPGAATAGSGAQPPTGISKAAIQELPSIAFVPRLDDRVGCRLDDDGLRCACPVAGQALTFEPAYGAHFTVSFAPVSGDGESVRVTSRGCIGDGSACAHAFMAASAASAALVASSASAAFASRPDALSCVQATLKLSPRMMQVPTAAITAGREVRLGITSQDNQAKHDAGWLIHAGASI